MKSKIQHKTFSFEFKDVSSDDEYFYFEGYGSTFGNVDLGSDVVVKGAFTDSLKDRMPKMCYQHDMSRPIGVWTDAKEDSKGLFLKGKMPKDNSLVKDVISLMKCGALDSLSIGFQVDKDGSEYTKDGHRLIKKVKLYETSIVTMPMNPKAMVTDMKKFSIEDVEEIKTKRELEELLMETECFSKKAAVFIASHFKSKKPKTGDPDADDDEKDDQGDPDEDDDSKTKPTQGDPDENLLAEKIKSITQSLKRM